MKKNLIYAMLLAVATISMTIFVACGKDPDFSTTPLGITGAAVDRELDTIAVGDVLALRGHVVPFNASEQFQGVTWSSTNTAIATVNNEGVVTALAVGTTGIVVRTVAAPNYTDTSWITVIPALIPVMAVELGDDALVMVMGTTQTLVPTFIPSNATIRSVTWESSDDAIVTVNSSGVVTPRGVGTATITVTTTNGGFTAEREVVVNWLPTTVTLNETTLRLEAGDSRQLTASLTPNNANVNRTVLWSSSDPTVATVTNTGLVTAIKDGQAIIMAISAGGGQVGTCVVTVGEGGEVCEPEVTAANIETFVPDPTVDAVAAFLAGTESTESPVSYEITEMSTRLLAFRTAYALVVPAFDKFMLVMPSVSGGTDIGPTTAPSRSLAFSIRYTTTDNMWNFATANLTTAPLVPMTGGEDNPNSDATFAGLRRVDRTGGFGDATPHSSTFASLSGELLAAVRGIFNVSGTSDLVVDNTSLIGTLCAPTGWTIIQDNCNPRKFWFRSKAAPSDWFVAMRQP
jgi:uncharacterized protein YjdB